MRYFRKWSFFVSFLFAIVLLLFSSWNSRGSPLSTVITSEQIHKAKEDRYPAWIGSDFKMMPGAQEKYGNRDLELLDREPGDTTYWYRTTYQSYFQGSWEINTRSGFTDEISSTHVTNHPSMDIYPRFNPGSTRITFASDRDGDFEIYTMDASGADLRRLTNNEVDDSVPVWSHDGSQIVFSSERDGNVELYTMNSDGSEQVRLTFDSAMDIDATWSPDDSRLAWLRVTGEGGTVWIMDADGSRPYPFSVWCHFIQNLNWSPDGSKLVFDCDTNMDYWNEIVLLDAIDGSTSPVYHPGEYLRDYWVSGWTPDSKYIWCNRIQYIIYDGELYLANTNPFAFEISSGRALSIQTGYLAMQLSTERGDATIPRSRVATLPKFSRAGNFQVHWSGTDPGPAPIEYFDLQYKKNQSGSWQNWFTQYLGYPNFPVFFSGTSGSTVFFRSRARDEAGNVELWPTGDGDTFTTLFTWLLSGTVHDSRSVALPAIALDISPDPIKDSVSDYLGHYRAWLESEGDTNVSVVEPVSGQSLTVNLNMLDDRMVDLYFPVDDNQIQNGGFEIITPPFESWQTSGTLTKTQVAGYFGDQTLLMGTECSFPCLGPVTQIHTITSSLSPLILPGLNGTIHMLADGAYYLYSPSLGWSEPEPIWNPGHQQPDAVVDLEGNLHVVWWENHYLHYKRRDISGNWSDEENLVYGNPPSIAVDTNGRVIITYASTQANPNGHYYLERKPGGGWMQPVLFKQGVFDQGLNKVAADASNRFHMVVIGDIGRVIHFTLLPDGSISKEIIATEDVEALDMMVDLQDNLHLSWLRNNSYRVVYMKLDTHLGIWSAPFVLPESIFSLDMTIDPEMNVHIVGSAEPGFYYFQKDPSSGWFPPILLHTETVNTLPAVTVDTERSLHFVWEDVFGYYKHQTLSKAIMTEYGTISQALSIPANLHEPTLAFDFNLMGGGYWKGNRFDVLVTTGVTDTISSTAVFSSSSRTTWGHTWVDMSPWAGELISLTFKLQQAEGDPFVKLWLDNVSLGSWSTPRVTDISPHQVEVWKSNPVQVTITGENFIDPPSIYLGDIEVDGNWIDEKQLSFSIPVLLDTGAYEVYVENPGGQRSAAPVRLLLGKQYFLPRIANSG